MAKSNQLLARVLPLRGNTRAKPSSEQHLGLPLLVTLTHAIQ